MHECASGFRFARSVRRKIILDLYKEVLYKEVRSPKIYTTSIILLVKKIFILLVALIALSCCIELGEKIIGEKSRDAVFMEGHENRRDEVIIGPGDSVSVSVAISEPSYVVFIHSGSANLKFTFKHPNGDVDEMRRSRPYLLYLGQGSWSGDRCGPIKGTGLFEVSATNLEERPAYLWYTLYIVPNGTPDEKLKEYNMGNSLEIEYLVLQ